MAIFARSAPTFARCVHRHAPLTQTNMRTVRRVRRRARTALQPAQNMRASGTSNFLSTLQGRYLIPNCFEMKK